MEKRLEMKMKKWFFKKTYDVAKTYNTFIDSEESEDGYVTVVVMILGETEKAVQVILESGSIVGTCKGWKTWVPKSVVNF